MKPAAVLDIGSSKVVCLCGSTSVRGGTVVHGVGISEYSGFADGAFFDIADLEDAIITAIRGAEENARIRIRDIVLSVPSPFSKLIVTESSLRTESGNDRISSGDIDELISSSLSKAKASGYVLMHSTPIAFKVDGYETSDVPQGQKAGEVAAKVSHMFVEEKFLETVTNILHTLSIEVSMCVSAQLAESILLIPEEERVRPSVLIDVGFYQTDISVIENSALIAMVSLNIGGYHFTNDLAFGLDVPFEAAEQVKRKYSFLQNQQSDSVTIRMLTGVKTVSQSSVDIVMNARASELADMISETLLSMKIRPETRPVVYITGGGFSMMHGGCDYLRQSLGLNIKRDMPYIPDMDTPNYASAFGTLDFVLQAASHGEESGDFNDDRNFFEKVKDIFVS